MAKITVAFMRQVYTQMEKEEISYSRMVEMLNEKAKEKWYENKKVLDAISEITVIVVSLLCILYFFLTKDIKLYIHLTVSIGCAIVAGCEYQVARLYNKSYIPVWIGGILCLLNFLCFLGYIK